MYACGAEDASTIEVTLSMCLFTTVILHHGLEGPPTLLPMATFVVRSGITLMREASLTFVVDPRVSKACAINPQFVKQPQGIYDCVISCVAGDKANGIVP